MSDATRRTHARRCRCDGRPDHAGITRLAETATGPRARDLEVVRRQLDDPELAILERALGKVIIDCSFG
jgi:hypothetical protein